MSVEVVSTTKSHKAIGGEIFGRAITARTRRGILTELIH